MQERRVELLRDYLHTRPSAANPYNDRLDETVAPNSIDAIAEARRLPRINEGIARDVKETKDIVSANRFDELVLLGFQLPITTAS